jgi:triphosphoribosyl-dephospho-CoA synthase
MNLIPFSAPSLIEEDERERCRRLADLATRALIEEAELTPKPALVDRRGAGAHSDLSLELMKRSARCLRRSFELMAITAVRQPPDQALREDLGAIGRSAEYLMLSVTGGVNTHRGAIWTLGLLVSAAAMVTDCQQTITSLARISQVPVRNAHEASIRRRRTGASRESFRPGKLLPDPPRLRRSELLTSSKTCEKFKLAAELARIPDRHAPMPKSNGSQAVRRYGVSGAEEEAKAGFPHVRLGGLSMLHHSRRQGMSETTARLNALLAIMRSLGDTCLLHRGGLVALNTAQAGAAAILAAGGAGTARGWQLLRDLDRALIDLNASPGGSADLLAGTLFVDLICSAN